MTKPELQLPETTDTAAAQPPAGKPSKALVAGLFATAAAVFAVGRLLLDRRVQRDRR